MNQQEIIEFNRKCAEFLGKDKTGTDVTWTFPSYLNGKLWVDEHFFNNDNQYCGRRQTEVYELKFHSDWNWIMQVVDKIEELGYKTEFNSTNKIKSTLIYKKRGEKYVAYFGCIDKISKKKAATETINEFIDWYNEKNLPNKQ